MKSNRTHWSDEIDFTVTDSDAPQARGGSPEEPGRDHPGRPVSLRWCLLALATAIGCALASGLLYQHRSRTILSTRLVPSTQSAGRATQNLTGCPFDANCTTYDYPDGGSQFHLVQHYLPTAELIQASNVVDSSSTDSYLLTLTARTPDGILITVSATLDPARRTVPAWRSPVPAAGPAEVTLVVAGPVPGQSAAVSATIPAGVSVPVSALQRLAADKQLQLTNP